jgi:hypothetical protein
MNLRVTFWWLIPRLINAELRNSELRNRVFRISHLMLDKHKAAAHLGVSPRTLENYMNATTHRALVADRVESKQGGKQYFFETSTLDEYKGYLQSLKATKRETPKSEETALAKLRSNDLLPAILQRFGDLSERMIDVSERRLLPPIPPEPTPSRLVTYKQAAEESGLSVATIAKAVKAKKLKEVKGIGKRGASLLRLSDVMNYASSLFD